MHIEKRTYQDERFKKVYMLWYNIYRRCYNKDYPQYKNYGAKGVFMSERWQNLDHFIEDVDKIEGFDLAKFLEGKLVLDKDIRSFGNKEYCLANCVFTSIEKNNRNKPNQQKPFCATSPDGEEFEVYSQSEFAREHGLRQSNISNCLRGGKKRHKGWTFKYM